MMTVEPLAALAPLAGNWLKTGPWAYCAGPEPCWTLTANPAVVRIWLAVAWESPMTEGTAPAPPDTVIVTVEPGAAVPLLGLWLITWPAGAVEVASALVWTWKPLPVSVDSAALCCWATTLGTVTGAAPLETYSVTRVLAGTMLPSAGVDLMTRPVLTLALASSTTAERRCWAVIWPWAVATVSPFTSGTE